MGRRSLWVAGLVAALLLAGLDLAGPPPGRAGARCSPGRGARRRRRRLRRATGRRGGGDVRGRRGVGRGTGGPTGAGHAARRRPRRRCGRGGRRSAAGGRSGVGQSRGPRFRRAQIAVGVPGAAPDRRRGAMRRGRAGSGGRVDLNAAGGGELDALPGIGPVLAQRIVDHRTATGRSRSVDELDDVPGIGPAIAAELAELVRGVSRPADPVRGRGPDAGRGWTCGSSPVAAAVWAVCAGGAAADLRGAGAWVPRRAGLAVALAAVERGGAARRPSSWRVLAGLAVTSATAAVRGGRAGVLAAARRRRRRPHGGARPRAGRRRPHVLPGPRAPRVVADATVTALTDGARTHGLDAEVLLFAPGDGWRDLLPGQPVRVRADVSPPRPGDDVVAVVSARGPPTPLGRAERAPAGGRHAARRARRRRPGGCCPAAGRAAAGPGRRGHAGHGPGPRRGLRAGRARPPHRRVRGERRDRPRRRCCGRCGAGPSTAGSRRPSRGSCWSASWSWPDRARASSAPPRWVRSRCSPSPRGAASGAARPWVRRSAGCCCSIPGWPGTPASPCRWPPPRRSCCSRPPGRGPAPRPGGWPPGRRARGQRRRRAWPRHLSSPGLSGTVSLVSLPANLLAAPAVAPATVLGLAATVLGPVAPSAGGRPRLGRRVADALAGARRRAGRSAAGRGDRLAGRRRWRGPAGGRAAGRGGRSGAFPDCARSRWPRWSAWSWSAGRCGRRSGAGRRRTPSSSPATSGRGTRSCVPTGPGAGRAGRRGPGRRRGRPLPGPARASTPCRWS